MKKSKLSSVSIVGEKSIANPTVLIGEQRNYYNPGTILDANAIVEAIEDKSYIPVEKDTRLLDKQSTPHNGVIIKYDFDESDAFSIDVLYDDIDAIYVDGMLTDKSVVLTPGDDGLVHFSGSGQHEIEVCSNKFTHHPDLATTVLFPSDNILSLTSPYILHTIETQPGDVVVETEEGKYFYTCVQYYNICLGKIIGIVAQSAKDRIDRKNLIMSAQNMSLLDPENGSNYGRYEEAPEDINMRWGISEWVEALPNLGSEHFAVRDYNGRYNTIEVLKLVNPDNCPETGEIPFNPSDWNGYYPAFMCCHRYDPSVILKKGDWYLPAMGELATMYESYDKIYKTLLELNSWYMNVAPVSQNNSDEFGYFVWASTLVVGYYAWGLDAGNGSCGGDFKDIYGTYFRVRAFSAL